jgi:hypothetical protein
MTTFLDASQSPISKLEFIQRTARHASTPSAMEAEQIASCPRPSREESAAGPKPTLHPHPRGSPRDHEEGPTPLPRRSHDTPQPLSKEEPPPHHRWVGDVQKLHATTSTATRGTELPPRDRRGCHMRPRSDPSDKGVGWGWGRRGRAYRAHLLAWTPRDDCLRPPLSSPRLDGSHPGSSNRHARGGRWPLCRHPCRPYELCRRSTPAGA